MEERAHLFGPLDKAGFLLLFFERFQPGQFQRIGKLFRVRAHFQKIEHLAKPRLWIIAQVFIAHDMHRQSLRLGPAFDVLIPAPDHFEQAARRGRQPRRIKHRLNRLVDAGSGMAGVRRHDIERIAHDIDCRRRDLRRDQGLPLNDDALMMGLHKMRAVARIQNQAQRLWAQGEILFQRTQLELAARRCIVKISANIPQRKTPQLIDR